MLSAGAGALACTSFCVAQGQDPWTALSITAAATVSALVRPPGRRQILHTYAPGVRMALCGVGILTCLRAQVANELLFEKEL